MSELNYLRTANAVFRQTLLEANSALLGSYDATEFPADGTSDCETISEKIVEVISNYPEHQSEQGVPNSAESELAAALSKVMQWVEAHPRKATIVESVKEEARAALAKARGMHQQNKD